jgi:importin subunit beta-1
LAEKQLQSLRDQNLAIFLLSLCAELANNERDPNIRSLAGLILKNSLDSADEVKRGQLIQSWLNLPVQAREQIKVGVLQTLNAAHPKARHTAAAVVAKIGKIEISRGLWPNLIDTLLAASLSQAVEAKQAALETLGYICEEMEGDALQEKANQILTAVVSAMRKEEPNGDVRIAGVTAFINALEFIRGNMEKENERTYIMLVVCEGTQAEQPKLREMFFEALNKIASFYYDKISTYMHQIFQITLEAIRRDQETVAKQAIEFWSAIADEEIGLLEALEEGEEPDYPCANYIRGALKFLVPILTETLAKQEEDTAEEDDWTLPIAAGTCLALVANTVGDEVVPEVMPFVRQHLNNPDWRFREAATMAFGSILQGPKESIEQIIAQALPFLLDHMRDPSPAVKDTTAWTLGRICQTHPQSIGEQLQRLVQVFMAGLQDEPKVASNVGWALHNLARAHEEESTSSTGHLSVYFTQLIQVLLATTERKDAAEFRFRSASYEAINSLIICAAQDCIPFIVQLVPHLLDRLQKTFTMQVLSTDDKEEQNEQQALLCSVLSIVSQKLGGQIKPFSDKMMILYLQVFASKSATLHEEALMAVGALANACEVDFDKYMGHLRPHLAFGLRNWEEHQVCSVAVGVVGDICRAIGDKILPYCNEIITLLLGDLQNPHMNRDVKPLILSTFGDIALAIGGQFETYLMVVMSMLAQACMTEVDPNNYDLVDFLNSLRESIFEAYTGIFQGMRSDGKTQLLEPYAEGIFNFMEKVFTDHNTADYVRRAGLGTLGDVVHALGPKIKRFVQKDWVRQLIVRSLKDHHRGTKEVAMWVKSVVDSVK